METRWGIKSVISSTKLVKELRLDGVTSKPWTTQVGRVREGKPIDKSLIYKVLSNRVYLGEIRHRDQWYPGEHPPIVEDMVWEAAQAMNRTPRVEGVFGINTESGLICGTARRS
jgi:site-specific DNA recombinase